MCAYQVFRFPEWATTTIQAGSAPSAQFQPTYTTSPAAAALTGVPYAATRSMPLWKCAQPLPGRVVLEGAAAVLAADREVVHRPAHRAVERARDVAARDLPGDHRVDLALELLLVHRGLADDRGGVPLVARERGEASLLLGERPGDLLLEPAKLLLRLLQRAHRLVEIALLGGGLLAQDVGPCSRVGHRLVDRRERLLGLGDLVGEGAVLLADIDVVGHLREQVGERATGQERLERRRPVGVVRAADAIGELGPALGELDPLRGFLRR